ncbi:MAG: stage III sporulation protein AA [Anaerovoracaceae bacterium]|jgi:stage III sporulation protein AA
MKGFEQILAKLPTEIQSEIKTLPGTIIKGIEEIRLKVGHPLVLSSNGKEYQLIGEKTCKIDNSEMNNIFNSLLNHSAYAYQEELSKGYITIDGGHRVGICGRVIIENGKVKAIKNISSLNIRRSREIIGVSDQWIPYLLDENGRLLHTVIVSPPMCGKTTLLRDIIRNLSNLGMKVGVCDERSEIAGSFQGESSFNLGMRSDVLDGCPKEEGMIMLIRAMSPDVIATDEIGKPSDIYGIQTAICAGVSLLTTIHGKDYQDLLRSGIGEFVKTGIFKRLLFLSNDPNIGTVTNILDEKKCQIL